MDGLLKLIGLGTCLYWLCCLSVKDVLSVAEGLFWFFAWAFAIRWFFGLFGKHWWNS